MLEASIFKAVRVCISDLGKFVTFMVGTFTKSVPCAGLSVSPSASTNSTFFNITSYHVGAAKHKDLRLPNSFI